MSNKITFLGTSCMVPTKERNVTSLFMRFRDEGLLFDCGEGTQRQMNIGGINRNNITRIFISHWHADHVGGLMGLLHTVANRESEKIIEIHGPRGTQDYIDHLTKSCATDTALNIQIHEHDPESVECILETDTFFMYAGYLDHTIPCLGYKFIEKDRFRIKIKKIKELGLREGPWLNRLSNNETVTVEGHTLDPKDYTSRVKGKKVSVLLDTQLCQNYYTLAQDATILISEAAYLDVLEEKATQFKHMTVRQAAHVASEQNVGTLILTHFSQRYKTVEELEAEAQAIFPDTICAYDFMNIKF